MQNKFELFFNSPQKVHFIKAMSDNSNTQLIDISHDVINTAIVNISSEKDAIKERSRLSNTCKSYYNFFQLTLDQLAAQQLLTYVLQSNAEKAKRMYIANPRLLFIEATAKEYASGIGENWEAVHRIVKTSPLRAMAGCGDPWMLRETFSVIANYTDKKTGIKGTTLAKEQLIQQFPNGFDYPPSTYDFGSIVNAIRNYDDEGSFYISDKIMTALAQFRKDFMPGTVSSGYFFNLNELVAALEIFNKHKQKWSNNNTIFQCRVLAYLERLVTSVDAIALTQDITDMDVDKKLKRSFIIHDNTLNDAGFFEKWYFKGRYDFPYYPCHPEVGIGLSLNPHIRKNGTVDRLKNLCRAKAASLNQFMQYLEDPSQRPFADKLSDCVDSLLACL